MRGSASEAALPKAGGGAHIEEVGRDLTQMNALIEAAIEKLLVGFMAIHHGVSGRQKMLQESAINHPEFAACSARMDSLREEIALHVGEAVSGL